MTIGEAIRVMHAAMRVKLRPRTVDTLKAGRPEWPLRGIATTFMPTHDVIRRAAAGGANLLICHEPLLYNHRDETAWLRGDRVSRDKRRLLAKLGMAVYRAHDTWHDRRPDGILAGMVDRLGWARYQRPRHGTTFVFPRWPVSRIIATVKRRLGIPQVRVVGSTRLVPRKVAFLAGAWGGRNHIAALRRPRVELLLCGEAPEWETYEYVRDAAAQGARTALVVLGHAASEEAGMAYLGRWLAPRLPGIRITHVPSGLPYRAG